MLLCAYLRENDVPQNLFIERCMDFLVPGGRMALVLPDGIYGNDGLGYIRQFIMNNGRIIAVIDLPKETFMPYTSTKTSVILIQKYKDDNDRNMKKPVFMALCESCGHDRRGNVLMGEDDISSVAKEFSIWREKNGITF